MRGRVVGLQMNCLLVIVLCGIKLTQVCPRHAAVVMGLRGIRANIESRVVAAYGLGIATELVQCQATVGVGIGVGGLERQRSVKGGERVG